MRCARTLASQALSERLDTEVVAVQRSLQEQNSKFVDICIGVDNKITRLNAAQVAK